MDYKLNIGDPKSGKTFKKDVSGPEAKSFFGKKIGDKVEGDKIGLEGYEFEIRGGSDYCGFPMRPDVSGGSRKRILILKGIGNRDNWEGRRRRRTVVGSAISDKIVQINLKIIKHGKAPLGEVKEGEAKADDKAGKEAQPGVKKEEKVKPADKKEVKPEPEAKAEKKEAKLEKEAKKE